MTTKEKPIIFSTPLIPAIQNLKPGTWPPEPIDPGKPWKWQTRRVIKPQPQRFFEVNEEPLYLYDVEWNLGSIYPKYQPGDILWVQETFAIGKIVYGEEPDGRAAAYISQCKGENDYIPKEYALRNNIGIDEVVWKPPANMPRDAARLFLEVKSARAERLWDITEEDARAEGCYCTYEAAIPFQRLAGQSFEAVWGTLYAKRGYPWKNNDWVWVYEFMRANGS